MPDWPRAAVWPGATAATSRSSTPSPTSATRRPGPISLRSPAPAARRRSAATTYLLPTAGRSSPAARACRLVETPAVAARPDPAAEVLDGTDPAVVAEMLALVARNQPGPFLSGTPRMGTYLGIRHEGRLVAMAGERVHPQGWTEISAVCTDADFRGRGLASRLVLAVAAGIHARGERALMHAAATNTGAISVYLGLGFEPAPAHLLPAGAGTRHGDRPPPRGGGGPSTGLSGISGRCRPRSCW
ncbi:GNAT family N-acetyltransferase [Nocardioides convexus]|uniref:GNAT family N-acetyltransferase n=1 Tax=Nocardioides convexus TaxID=2712224 RepID=UPI0024189F5C|nr:GNAT family N-acetyltransferase [Nocardioides convexus]